MKKRDYRRTDFSSGLLLAFTLLAVTSAPVAAQSVGAEISALLGGGQPLFSKDGGWLNRNTPRALRETSDPEVWTEVASESEKSKGASRQVRILSEVEIPLPGGLVRDALVQSSYTLLGRRVVVASTVTDSGELLYTAAVMMDFGATYVDRDGTPVQLFVAVFTSPDLARTTEFARELAAAYNGEHELSELPNSVREPETNDQSALAPRCGCEEACDLEHQDALALCNAEVLACIAVAAALATVCILACPPCTPACLAVQVAMEADCIIDGLQCNKAATAQHKACLRECIVIP